MNHFQQLETSLKLRPILATVQIPAPLESKPAQREDLPWIKTVEMECADCGGSGGDAASWDPDCQPCPHCMGSGKETVTRNYLREAFDLAHNAESSIVPEREHVVAILQYVNRTVNDAHEGLGALKTFIPEVA
ncbi:MAG TPA: hypothetical protein VKX49_12435 [Bryobacteraceae bacterium]|nr:hypothetical protein [Bryobacteraceae bacterium]